MSIRVLLVDDHRVVLEGLGLLFDEVDAIEVVGRVSEVSGIAEAVRELSPEVVVCDLEMPGGDALEAVSACREHAPDLRIVVLSAFPSDVNIRRAIAAGAGGVLTKSEPAEAVVSGVEAIAGGRTVYSDEVRDRFRAAEGSPRLMELSPRELHVAKLVAEGMTAEEIAAQSFRSPRTIERQVASALQKTGSRNRVELARWVIREGLIVP